MSRLLPNLAANLAGSVIPAALNLIFAPLFLLHAGPEFYGLIGIATVVQGVLQVFDSGLSAAIMRSLSRLHHVDRADNSEKYTIRVIDGIFVSIILTVMTFLLFAYRWKLDPLSISKYFPASYLAIAALIISFAVLRIFGGIYRAALIAVGRPLAANAIFVASTAGRLVASFVVLVFYANPTAFFLTWVLVVAIECVVLRCEISKLLSTYASSSAPDLITSIRHFAPTITLSFTTIVWVISSQLDKILVSTHVTLQQFGYYSLALTITSSLFQLSGPVMFTIQPVLVRAFTFDSVHLLDDIVSFAMAYICIVVFPLSFLLVAYPTLVVYAWTGSHAAAFATSGYLPLYAAGITATAVSTIFYSVHLAGETLNRHLAINTAQAILVTLLYVHFIPKYGAVGAGYCFAAVSIALMGINAFLSVGKYSKRSVRNIFILLGAVFGVFVAFAFGAAPWLERLPKTRATAFATSAGIYIAYSLVAACITIFLLRRETRLIVTRFARESLATIFR